MIKLVDFNELDRVDELAILSITEMKKAKIDQWDETYPRKEHFHDDISEKCLYGYYDNGILLGVVALKEENDPPYKDLSNWKDEVSFVIHRMLVSPEIRGLGIGRKLFDFAHDLARSKGFTTMKVDTHLENYIMRSILEKNGYYEVGYLPSINRIAYEKVL